MLINTAEIRWYLIHGGQKYALAHESFVELDNKMLRALEVGIFPLLLVSSHMNKKTKQNVDL